MRDSGFILGQLYMGLKVGPQNTETVERVEVTLLGEASKSDAVYPGIHQILVLLEETVQRSLEKYNPFFVVVDLGFLFCQFYLEFYRGENFGFQLYCYAAMQNTPLTVEPVVCGKVSSPSFLKRFIHLLSGLIFLAVGFSSSAFSLALVLL